MRWRLMGLVYFYVSLINLNAEVLPKNPFIVMIGPTVHFNMENGKSKTSWGVEASCWFNDFGEMDDIDYSAPIPIGVDLGYDSEKGKYRFYSELQMGRMWFGVAAGPVMEINKETKDKKIGIQGSLWANALLGFNARYRYINNTGLFAPGLYIKIPTISNFQYIGE